MHSEEGRHPFEPGSVPDAGRDRHDRRRDEATDDARERTFHACHDDYRVGPGELFVVGEQTVDAGDTAVGEDRGHEAERTEGGGAFAGDGKVGGPGRHDHDLLPALVARTPVDDVVLGFGRLVRVDRAARARLEGCGDLVVVRPCQQHGTGPVGEQLAGDRCTLAGALARRVDRLRHALPEAAVMVHLCKAEISEGPARELLICLVGGDRSASEVRDQLAQLLGVHQAYYPASMNQVAGSLRRIAYLGPRGTFSEEALVSQPDLAGLEHVATTTIPDAIALVVAAEVDAAFVPFENSIEGSVNLTLDQLVFDVELLIQREVVLEVHMDLLARPGETMTTINRVLSFPFATAQVRGFLADRLGGVPIEATNSTADGARLLGEDDFDGVQTAAVAPPLTASIYGLEVLAHAIEDHPGNQTRFLLVARDGVPPPTGRDRTTIACFQRRDRPGSLYEILGAFARRAINLTRIESRPTRQGLGDYCFVIEFEGHVDDDSVGTALSDLYSSGVNVKFLGSYPVHGEAPLPLDSDREPALGSASEWLAGLRARGVPVR